MRPLRKALLRETLQLLRVPAMRKRRSIAPMRRSPLTCMASRILGVESGTVFDLRGARRKSVHFYFLNMSAQRVLYEHLRETRETPNKESRFWIFGEKKGRHC